MVRSGADVVLTSAEHLAGRAISPSGRCQWCAHARVMDTTASREPAGSSPDTAASDDLPAPRPVHRPTGASLIAVVGVASTWSGAVQRVLAGAVLAWLVLVTVHMGRKAFR